MANLSISVGPVTATINAGDAKATAILTDYAAAYGIEQTGTAQERLQRVVRHLAGHIQEVAAEYQVRTELETRRVQVADELAARGWD